MSPFSSFALSFGSLLAIMALIAAWLFRTASAPLWAKVAIPSLAVALSCYTPFAISSMMGLPVPVGFDGLPDRAELVAFVPFDEEKRVDLWLRPRSSTGSEGDEPRAYETALTAQMKQTLREAVAETGRGRPAMLMKRGTDRKKGQPGGQDALGLGDNQQMYVLDPSPMGLPPKD
jgi:hypothetical protein